MDIGSLFGSGAGLVALGLAWLLIKFADELPQAATPWALRVAIVIMGMGGVAIAYTVLGGLFASLATAVINWGGGTGWAIASIVVALLFLTVVFALWKRPNGKAAYTAVGVALMLPVFSGGILADINQTVEQPSREATVEMQTWLNGRGGE